MIQHPMMCLFDFALKFVGLFSRAPKSLIWIVFTKWVNPIFKTLSKGTCTFLQFTAISTASPIRGVFEKILVMVMSAMIGTVVLYK